MGYIHAELMSQYAEDAKQYDEPWKLWQYCDSGGWVNCVSHPSWYSESQYRRTSQVVSDEQIKAVFLANGFTMKEGMTDLKPYVYQAARALLATCGQAQADVHDAERWTGIGKAIERACADLPEETEIIVSLENGAGTVTLIDKDGNEHENFSTDYGFAGVLNEAIDAALAAEVKKGG